MRLHRPAVLAALALGTVLPVTAANAATGVAAAGSAVSGATIATVAVGGLVSGLTVLDPHTIAVGSLTSSAQTITSAAPAVSFVPVTVDGVKSGAVTVTPANSPTTIGGVTTGLLPFDVISATSPAATLSASKAATGATSALTASLGSIKVLGLPIVLNGTIAVGSGTDATHANAGKTVSIKNVSFPSIGALLAALGLDVTKLPVPTLNALIQELPVTIGSTTLAAYNVASSNVDDAYTAVTTAQGAVADATADLATKTTDFDSALSTATISGADFTDTGVAGVPPLDHTDWDTLGTTTLGQAAQGVILTATTGLAAKATAYDSAKTALTTANGALGTAIGALAPAIAILANIVSDVLDGTSLLSVGAAEVGTTAAVGSTKTAKVTGYVSGVKVLGLDVLGEVTGNSKLDVAKLVGTTANEVNATIGALTSTLSSILSSATGATGLVIPAPSIQLLTKSTSTGKDGAFGTADVAVNVLQMSMGEATIPRAFALSTPLVLIDLAKSKANVPAIPGKSPAFSVKVGTLAEAARYRAATVPATTPGSGSELPSTGAPYGLALVAVAGAGLALGARRHLRAVRA
jgi:hypothetical protein